tara:strand:+ start:128 stop:835 length:708 start_codon:yes stop_codon:yes gene_type:complete
MSKVFNVYCDESSHLENGDNATMVIGCVYCPADESKLISSALKELKVRHGIRKGVETKWTKVSKSKQAYYLDLLEFFFSNPSLKFRAVVIPDKSKLDHAAFKQRHTDWYYKMHYYMLDWIIVAWCSYNIYLDIKDTKGGDATKELHKVLKARNHDYDGECVQKVQQIRSHESEILQLADFLIGALSYAFRELDTNEAKKAVSDELIKVLPASNIKTSTSYTYKKFNYLVWSPRDQ